MNKENTCQAVKEGTKEYAEKGTVKKERKKVEKLWKQ